MRRLSDCTADQERCLCLKALLYLKPLTGSERPLREERKGEGWRGGEKRRREEMRKEERRGQKEGGSGGEERGGEG